ncbi:unnamed protein product [Trifolium pratense]|uniref:Uncharacterized protein n=1 Tax=Trifolium pratense TaxID=57577 RepID=A0ACB0JEI5_TRIPR|nr:unnamed protein product [Trifolium pratense]
MAASKAYLSFLLINLSSFFHLCLCDGGGSLEDLLPSLAQSAGLLDPQCMQKLLPCQPYLKAPNNPPPACCNPLSELAANSSDCICNLINNPKLLAFEASKEEILKLPTACGVDVDASKCNANAGTSPTSEGNTPSSEVEDETAAEDAAAEDSASSTKIIPPYGITYFGVPGFVALLTALVFSAY